MKQHYIGLDIGGTKCAAIIGDASGTIIQRIAFVSGSDIAPQKILSEFYVAIDSLLCTYADGLMPCAIGISCGGPLDSKRGVIQCPPNLPLWDEIPICELMAVRYHCPVFLQNDANACAMAEWKFGAGIGTQNMIFLTFGTGLGAGLILNGQLYEGTNGMAGEIGHIRLAADGPIGYGKAGSFEGFCSGGGIRQLGIAMLREQYAKGQSVDFWPETKPLESITAKEICVAAQDGSEIAQSILNCSASYLGAGLAVLLDILNPECIVIGSIFTRTEKYFRPTMEAMIAQEALLQSAEKCRIVPAILGDSIGDVAALTIAVMNFKG